MLDAIHKLPIKYISFDLYGTLFKYDDLEASWQRWAAELYASLKAVGLQVSFSTFQQDCDAFFSQSIQPLDGHTVFSTRIVQFAENQNIQIDAQQAHKIADDCCHAWQEHISLHPSATTLLAMLQPDFSLFLITNFDHPPFVREMLIRTGISDYFQEILISGELGAKKPQRDIFNGLREKYDIEQTNCVHVGDSMDDYHFAANNDICPVLIGTDDKVNGVIDFACHTTEQVKGATVVTDLAELAKVINPTHQNANLL